MRDLAYGGAQAKAADLFVETCGSAVHCLSPCANGIDLCTKRSKVGLSQQTLKRIYWEVLVLSSKLAVFVYPSHRSTKPLYASYNRRWLRSL